MGRPALDHPWTTADDVRSETERLWTRGALLATLLHDRIGPKIEATDGCTADAGGQLTFPLKLRLRRPKSVDLGNAFDLVRRWIAELEAAARTARGSGFDIAWEEINSRQLGRNRIPAALSLPSLDDALALIGRSDEAAAFLDLATATIPRFPNLERWLRARPLAVLEHQSIWAQLLDCLDWFQANPRSGVFARQIDVAGIDSKFIEAHKAILSELLDQVLPSVAITPSANGVAMFEARYGLAVKPALVRLRVLDRRLAVAGLTDLIVRASELAALDIRPERVLIVENEITGLAFPPAAGSLLIFGGGYAIDQLGALTWLRRCPIGYWGDIDTHGFVILDRLRAMFPQTRSLLMDRDTLIAHRAAWSFETAPYVANLHHLTAEEAVLYDDLRLDRHGNGIRLEQERIPMRLVVPHL